MAHAAVLSKTTEATNPIQSKYSGSLLPAATSARQSEAAGVHRRAGSALPGRHLQPMVRRLAQRAWLRPEGAEERVRQARAVARTRQINSFRE